ncbi:MAG: branched-chain amino acid ABC transporter substrate-binding protein [Gemmatimonadota bacterium]
MTDHQGRRFRVAYVLLASAFAISGVGCGEPRPYVIGVALDRSALDGVAAAAQRINARGGIDGHRLVIDTASGVGGTTARGALEAAEKFAADPRILAVIGHSNSGTSLAASQVYNTRHVVQISPAATSPLYSDAGPYSFRLVGSDVHQAAFLAGHIARSSAAPRAAIMYVNNDYGRPLHDAVVENLRTAGIVPVYVSPFAQRDSAGDAEVLDALTRARPTVLMWIGRAFDLQRIARELRVRMPNLLVLASDAFPGGGARLDSAGLLDGVRHVRLLDLDRADTVLAGLRASYRKDGRDINDQAVLSYDAVNLLAEAIRAMGPDRERIRVWVEQIGMARPVFAGISGSIAFGPQGDRQPQYFLYVIGKKDDRPLPDSLRQRPR